MMLRTIQCGVCGATHTEPKPGEGWLGWGQFQGINLNGDENPYLCPTHLAVVADFVSKLADKKEVVK